MSEWVREDDYCIDTDPVRLEVPGIVDFLLNDSYWANGLEPSVIQKSIGHSLSYGLYAPEGPQVGYARVVTDTARYAFLADIFIRQPHQGRGLSVWLVETILADPELKTVARWALRTRDAHSLYEKFGFKRTGEPEGRAMEMTRS